MIGRYPIYQEIRFLCQSHRHSTNQRTRWMGGKSIPYWNNSPLIWRSCMHALMLRDYCLLDLEGCLCRPMLWTCVDKEWDQACARCSNFIYMGNLHWWSWIALHDVLDKNMELNDLLVWLEKLSFTNLNGFQGENGLPVFSVK